MRYARNMKIWPIHRRKKQSLKIVSEEGYNLDSLETILKQPL